MDEKQIEYILAVAEEKSISKAARKLFISQPSLSQFINRVEAQLGIILFDRSTSPLALTDEGLLYVETAKKIKALSMEMERAFEDIHGLKRGRLHIGLTPSKANHPLPDLLSVFKKRYPGIEIFLVEASSAQLEDFLLSGLCDLCITNLPGHSENIVFEPIFSEKILIATPPGQNKSSSGTVRKSGGVADFPEGKISDGTGRKSGGGADFPEGKISDGTGRKSGGVADFPEGKISERQVVASISIKDLKSQPFILLRQNQRLRKLADTLFAKTGIKVKILLETTSIETALRLTTAGLGCTFVPESCTGSYVLPKQPDYYTLTDEELSWTIALAYQRNVYLTKAAQAFIEVVRECFPC